MLHVLSHWAHVVVLVLIVVHVRLEEWIFQELALHLLVEHVVFHIWSHAVGKHELVVLLAAISRVCYDFAAVEAELVTEGLQKGDERACLPADTGIGRAPDSDKWSSNSTQETFG